MTYFHPRDFDAKQPVIKDLSLIRKFKSYYGLSTAQDKLKKLLNEFNFLDVKTAVETINWSTKPVFSLTKNNNSTSLIKI